MQASPRVRPHPCWLAWANRPARAVAWTLAVSLVVLAATLALNGTGALGWRLATRRTAQVAYPLFLIAFTASALARLLPSATTRAIAARRRALGLAFATAQFVHGAAILAFVRVEGRGLDPDGSFWGGALGFALVAAMAATSNDGSVRRLGLRGWRALHRAGMAWLFVIYAVTYAGRVAADPTWWPGLVLLVAALAIRLAATLQSRSLRSSTLPIE
ncbi:MAG: hypothetical protein R3F35_13510 [Myxococcota bacterium]